MAGAVTTVAAIGAVFAVVAFTCAAKGVCIATIVALFPSSAIAPCPACLTSLRNSKVSIKPDLRQRQCAVVED